MYSKREREQYNIYRERTCAKLGITKNQYNWLRRKGEELHRSYEKDCNGEYLRENTAERIENRIYARVNEYIKKLGLYVYYQTDPRGATIYIDKNPIPGNNYTQANCIY